MNYPKIKEQIKFSNMLSKYRMNIDVKFTDDLEIINNNITGVVESGVDSVFKNLSANLQTKIVVDTSITNLFIELLKDSDVRRIETVCKEFEPKQLLQYDKEFLKQILNNMSITNECLGIFIEYGQKYDIQVEQFCEDYADLKYKDKLNVEWLIQNQEMLKGSLFKYNIFRDIDINLIKEVCKDENLYKLFNLLADMECEIGNLDRYNILMSNAKFIYDSLIKLRKYYNKDLFQSLFYNLNRQDFSVRDLKYIMSIVDFNKPVEENPELFNYADYIATMYRTELDFEVKSWQEELLVYAVSHEKKAFIELVKTNSELFNSISKASVLFDSRVYRELININTITVDTLKAFMKMCNVNLIPFYEGRIFTCKEFELLYHSTDYLRCLYVMLDDIPYDERIIRFREVAKHSVMITANQREDVAACLKERRVSSWRDYFAKTITNISMADTIVILKHYTKIKPYLYLFTSSSEVHRFLRNYTDDLTPETYRNFNILHDSDWIEIVNKLNIDSAFIDLYADNIKKFINEDGAYICRKYLDNGNAHKESLKHLITAEVMSAFKELKYYEDDLSREVGIDLPNKVKSNWVKNNLKKHKNFTVYEEDSFLTVMQIGEIPTHTCLSYKDGAYNHCLLACFDACKKFVFVKDEFGHILTRAMVRLVQVSDNKKEVRTDLEFVDLTKPSNINSKVETELAIVLETVYYKQIKQNDLNSVIEKMIAFVKTKAKEMGVQLLISKAYAKYLDGKSEKVTKYISINKSKSSKQYLDSYGAAASVSEGGTFYKSTFYK